MVRAIIAMANQTGIIDRYAYLDEQREKTVKLLADKERSLEEILAARLKAFGFGKKSPLDWIYKHDIGKVWSDYLQGIKEDHTSAYP